MVKPKGEPPVAPTVDTDRPYTTVYTDGSSTGRWGVGGWAWCVLDGPEAHGGDVWTTNQRMEAQAAHEAVRALPGLLLVVSDSAYVVNCFNDHWWVRWRERDFHKVANDDIWRPFIADVLARDGEVKFAWVKGHLGLPGNERADVLAKMGKAEIVEQEEKALERQPRCPECEQGKVQNCTGEVLDEATDQFVPCATTTQG